jgi:hypothetical protein
MRTTAMEMRTVIPLPDEVFASAEVLAHRLGLSRGELYACAVREFVEAHRRLGIEGRAGVPRGAWTGGPCASPGRLTPG